MKPVQSTQALAREAEELIRAGRCAHAIPKAKALVAQTPGNERAIELLATAQIGAGLPAEARAILEDHLSNHPTSIRLHRMLGSALRLEGRADLALNAFQHALELDAEDPISRCALAEMQLLMGQADSAAKSMAPVVAAGQWEPNAAIVHAMICSSLNTEREAIEPIEQLLQSQGLSHVARNELLYRLGGLHDRLGDFDKAFAAYDQANRAQQIPHDPDATERAIDEAIASWTPQAIENLPRSTMDDHRPILIVGMPRSGTSLVEQTLASHPEVFGGDERGLLTQIAMELDPPAPGQMPIVRAPSKIRKQAVGRASRRYLKLLDELSTGEPRVSDKMPINFLHLGLVAALLPGARIIHCNRDPLDTCLSCYFQNFSPKLSFAFNLEHLGRFHRATERLMAHWRTVLDLPILDVVYEDMVSDHEATARRLVEFIDLPWDDTCLRFHESDRVQMTMSNQQVRKPVYQTSRGRHERYATHINDLRQALHPDD